MPYLDLVVDKHHSLLSCDYRLLAYFCHVHGLQFDVFDEMGTRLLAMGHLIRGSCFACPDKSFSGCEEVRARVPNATQLRTSLLNEVLTCVRDDDHLRKICFSVGMGRVGDSIRNIDHLLAYLEIVRDGFQSCADVSFILTEVDGMPLYELLSTVQAHGVEACGSISDLLFIAYRFVLDKKDALGDVPDKNFPEIPTLLILVLRFSFVFLCLVPNLSFFQRHSQFMLYCTLSTLLYTTFFILLFILRGHTSFIGK